jgi:outer membrane protein assembly factor BamB
VAWSLRLGERDPAPAAAGGRLFLGGRDLVALDAASGRVLWRLSETLARSFNREIVRRLVDRDRGLSPEEVRAVRAASSYDLRGAVTRTPQVAGGLVLAATDDRFLYAVDPATGELRWRVAEGD